LTDFIDGSNSLAMCNEPLLIDKTRAAYLLDVSPREIERLISRGLLATQKIGRRQLLVYASLKSLCSEQLPVG
jgi:hypothetical protein